MTYWNRTNEFFALCQSLSSPSSPRTSSSPDAPAERTSAPHRYGFAVSELSDPKSELRTFHTAASHLSQQVYSTSMLLSELTALVNSRSRSLFVDEADRINLLILKIKTNINYLNTQLVETQTTIECSKRKLGRNSQAGQEATNVVGQLKDEFTNTTKVFKGILKVRSELMKERRDKRDDVFGRSGDTEDGVFSVLGNKPRVYEHSCGNNLITATSNISLGGKSHNNRTNSGALKQEEMTTLNAPARLDLDLTSGLMIKNMDLVGDKPEIPGGEIATQLPRPYGICEGYNVSASSNHNTVKVYPTHFGVASSYEHTTSTVNNDIPPLPIFTPFDLERMEEESGQSQIMNLIPDQSYQRERADVMSQVESNIVELGTIFNNLAVMVTEHKGMVQRVEENIDYTNNNINLSMTTLTNTLTNLRTNRTLFFKIFTFLLIFIILFISFFA